MKYVRCKVFEENLKEQSSMVLAIDAIWISSIEIVGVGEMPTVCILSAAHKDVLEIVLTPKLGLDPEGLIDDIMSKEYTNLDLAAATYEYDKYDEEFLMSEYEAVYKCNCRKSAVRRADSF